MRSAGLSLLIDFIINYGYRLGMAKIRVYLEDVELWRPVKGFEGVYSVSTLGRVRREVSISGKTLSKILPTGQFKSGYCYRQLTNRRVKRVASIHALTLETFGGKSPSPTYEINHKNGVKNDNRINNLEYVSRSENLIHAAKRGLMSKNLTPAKVREIRQLRRLGWSLGKIQKKLGVCKSTVGRVASGKYWGWLQ